MPKELKVKMPNGASASKTILRIIWKRMGIWPDVKKAMVEYKDSHFGMPANDAWVHAAIKYPPSAEEKRKYFREIRVIQGRKESYKARAAIKPELKNRTGIDVIDWLYANMAAPAGKETKSPFFGDNVLLEYYRNNPKEFYNNLWRPALLKQFKVGENGEDLGGPAPRLLPIEPRPTDDLMAAIEPSKPSPPVEDNDSI